MSRSHWWLTLWVSCFARSFIHSRSCQRNTMKIKYRVLENCTPRFSFSLCSIAGMSRPVTAPTQTVPLKLHVHCDLEYVTVIYTDQPQRSTTCQKSYDLSGYEDGSSCLALWCWKYVLWILWIVGWGLFLQHIWQMLDSTGIWTDHSRSNTVGFLSCAVTEYQDRWCVCGMHRYAITSTACSLLSTSPARSLMRLHMWKTEIPRLSGASMGVTTQTSLGLLWSLEVCCEETGNGCSSPSK